VNKLLVENAINITVNVPIIMFVFPIVKGLSFTGGVGSAVLLSIILVVLSACAVLLIAMVLLALGDFGEGDREEQRFKLLWFGPSLLSHCLLLTFLSGWFTLQVDSLGAAIVGTLFLMGMNTIVYELIGAPTSDGKVRI